ncbi:hypothetical protein [Corallococcus sp. AB038B]|uniref:hypothetical protein n=1 Tax=Corallococcus sp. AB038B TaxID=2316718 RepID=UPI000EC27A2E|nr:hypothetical protein [Corallococcus sp. AB038B]RKI00270.1 hypothetical protein D7Y04_17775 [Corallococcus sp. AB038B]
MASCPLFRTLLMTASLLLALPTSASAGDDTETRKKLVACINKEIVAANSNWKLSSGDLKKFTGIIDREIMKEPLVKKSSEEQMRVINEIENATRKEVPSLDLKAVDKMIETLKAKGMHCSSQVKR